MKKIYKFLSTTNIVLILILYVLKVIMNFKLKVEFFGFWFFFSILIFVGLIFPVFLKSLSKQDITPDFLFYMLFFVNILLLVLLICIYIFGLLLFTNSYNLDFLINNYRQ